jgi:ABC-2 type transport system ATP-binding protein
MLQTEQLTKLYGPLTAVDGVSFGVVPGEVLGFLGPNGAGKSTTMRMIAGFVAPTSGRASICGHDVERDPVRAKRCLGYLPEGAPSYGEMSVRGFLAFIADLRGLRAPLRRQRLDYVYAKLQLEPVLEQTIDTLSKGFRRRVGLAQAIVHDPPVLILDEPTDGLDPNQKHEVRTLINEMSRDKIVVISTHILEEVAAVCTRALIIARGRVVADDTPEGLAARSRYAGAVSFRLSVAADLEASLAAMRTIDGVADVELQPRERRLTVLPVPGQNVLDRIQQRASERQLALEELQVESGRLDEVFRAVTA